MFHTNKRNNILRTNFIQSVLQFIVKHLPIFCQMWYFQFVATIEEFGFIQLKIRVWSGFHILVSWVCGQVQCSLGMILLSSTLRLCNMFIYEERCSKGQDYYIQGSWRRNDFGIRGEKHFRYYTVQTFYQIICKNLFHRFCALYSHSDMSYIRWIVNFESLSFVMRLKHLISLLISSHFHNGHHEVVEFSHVDFVVIIDIPFIEGKVFCLDEYRSYRYHTDGMYTY